MIGKINVSISLKCIKWASDDFKCEPRAMSTGEPVVNATAGWKDMMKGHGYQQSGWLNSVEEAAQWLYNVIKEIKDSAPTSEWPSTGMFHMRSSGFIGHTGDYRKYKDTPLPEATAAEGNKFTRWLDINVSYWDGTDDTATMDAWRKAWSPLAYKLNLD